MHGGRYGRKGKDTGVWEGAREEGFTQIEKVNYSQSCEGQDDLRTERAGKLHEVV